MAEIVGGAPMYNILWRFPSDMHDFLTVDWQVFLDLVLTVKLQT